MVLFAYKVVMRQLKKTKPQMTDNKLNKEEKSTELVKYRDLILATIDYYIDFKIIQFKTDDFNSAEYYRQLKIQAEEHFRKGRLTKLKQWFRNLTEIQVECGDLKFNQYLKEKTKYEVDIFEAYFQRIEKVIEKGKITADNQFYEINNLVNQLCQIEPINKVKLDSLNKILADYEDKKSKNKKPNA